MYDRRQQNAIGGAEFDLDEQRYHLIRSYLSETQVNLIVADHTAVKENWRFLNLLPEINRLYYFQGGEGWIRLRGRDYYPKPGELFLLPAGVRTSFSVINENRFRKYWCHFSALVGEVHLFQLLSVPAFIQVDDHEAMRARFQELIELFHHPSLTGPLRIKSILYEIIALFLEKSSDIALHTGEMPSVTKIQTILAYVDQHLSEQMTIEQLARLVHFHPNYFMQVFKSVLGVSPIVYINRKRMEYARKLLVTGELPISQVAESIGMEPYYFSRIFKKWSGFTPTEYRSYNGDMGPHAVPEKMK